MVGLLLACVSGSLCAEDSKPRDTFRGGNVEWARLRHSGQYWNRHAESDNTLLQFVRVNTSLNIGREWRPAPANDLEQLCTFPFLFADTLRFLTAPERRNIAEYLRRGGFIFLDACANVNINPNPDGYLRDHLAIFRSMFADFRVEELRPEHEIFSIYFKMSAFPPQVKPGNSWADGPTNPLRLLYSGDRVVGIMSISGMQCSWSGVGHDGASAMKMVTNIYLYAINR